jgi:putative membrane protein
MSRFRSILPRDSWNARLLAIFLFAWAVSCVALPYPEYFAMQHVPTVLAVVGLVVVERRIGVSRTSFALVIAFLLLHVLGARYLYSYVPYDNWSERILGVRFSERFGFERNHYDRFVHFAFGLLFVLPLWEFGSNRLRLRRVWPAIAATCVVLTASAVYEIAEWAVAMTFAPDWAEAYNGQQGDIWDAQKDMALAWAGSILGVTVVAAYRRRRGSRKTAEVTEDG